MFLKLSELHSVRLEANSGGELACDVDSKCLMYRDCVLLRAIEKMQREHHRLL